MASRSDSGAKRVARAALALLYVIAGVMHLVSPDIFVKITPGWVPWPQQVILATGMAELAGALALAQPWSQGLRRLAGAALALYALCVFPANIHHFAMDMARPDHGWGLAYHLPRMALQPLLIWLALWSSGALPMRKRG
nr:DoxX family protein [Croceicoccus mobilis]